MTTLGSQRARRRLRDRVRRPTRVSVLVITAAPDGRESTESLRAFVEELQRRPDASAEVVFLRRDPDGHRDPWPGARVVDDLRTSRSLASLDARGMRLGADRIRGLVVRSWMWRILPSVIVLDDGLGERIAAYAPGRPVRIVRLNDEPAADAAYEQEGSAAAPIVMSTRSDDEEIDHIRVRPVVSRPVAIEMTDLQRRRQVRTSLGIPHDVPLVVGWGSDLWHDGPDLLVRLLWQLEHDRGVPAHGLWISEDPDVQEEVRNEAIRCGLRARIHTADEGSQAYRCCGDVVFLPYRSAGRFSDLVGPIMSGLTVVTFPVWSRSDPSVQTVDGLDLSAAAAAIEAARHSDRSVAAAAAVERWDAARFAERFLLEFAGGSDH